MAEIGRTQSDVQFAQIAAGLIRVDSQAGMIANKQTGGVRRILRPCSTPGCPELTPGGPCEQHRRARQREHEERRGSNHRRHLQPCDPRQRPGRSPGLGRLDAAGAGGETHGRKLRVDMERQPDPERELQVARYLSAAYVAYVHGAGMDYTRRKYADTPVGNFWLEVAGLVIEGMAMEGETAFTVAPDPKNTIFASHKQKSR
jgi:hypothetical protein